MNAEFCRYDELEVRLADGEKSWESSVAPWPVEKTFIR